MALYVRNKPPPTPICLQSCLLIIVLLTENTLSSGMYNTTQLRISLLHAFESTPELDEISQPPCREIACIRT